MSHLITVLFRNVVTLSLVGSYVILVVMLVRLLLCRAPRVCSYLLWGVVFLRLCCPVFPEADFSLIPAQLLSDSRLSQEKAAPPDNRETGKVKVDLGNPEPLEQFDTFVWSEDKETLADADRAEISGSKGRLSEKIFAFDFKLSYPWLSYLWLTGMLSLMGYHVYSYWSLKKRVAGAANVEAGVKEMKGEHLSFVLGIFRPVIYLSSELDESGREVVLCHERVHLQRKDYLIKPLVLGICCIHWFNPLVWLAFCLMNRDCEMSCDERVIRILGDGSKAVYSYTLLEEASKGESRICCRKGSVCALLSFGEDHVKNRVKHVLQYHKASLGMIAGAAVLLGVVLVCLCSNPRQELSSGMHAEQQDLEDSEPVRQESSGNIDAMSEEEWREALEKFATAYRNRDGDTLYELCLDKEKFEEWDEVIPLEGNGSGAKYAFGQSLPWVEGFDIDYAAGSDEAVIRFVLANSVPEYYMATEKVRLAERDGRGYVDHMAYKLYDRIETRDELTEIYDLDAGHPFDNAHTGYSSRFARVIFNHVWKDEKPAYYSQYRSPETAAVQLLHLGEGTAKVTEVLFHPRHPYSYGYAGDGSVYGEGTVVNLHYVFEKDQSEVDIPMVMAEQSKGIWMLSCGDMTGADERKVGALALPGENVKVVYREYADYDADGEWNACEIGSYPDMYEAYQVTSYGIYRLGYDYQCIFPYYIFTDEGLDVRFDNGKMYFPVDSHSAYSTDPQYDNICELNLRTGESRFYPLNESFAANASAGSVDI